MKTINPPASGSEKVAEVAEAKLRQEPPPGLFWNSPSGLWQRKTTNIAALSIVAILLHLVLRFGFHTTPATYQRASNTWPAISSNVATMGTSSSSS